MLSGAEISFVSLNSNGFVSSVLGILAVEAFAAEALNFSSSISSASSSIPIFEDSSDVDSVVGSMPTVISSPGANVSFFWSISKAVSFSSMSSQYYRCICSLESGEAAASSQRSPGLENTAR